MELVTVTIRRKNLYRVECSNPFTGKQEYIGLFATELEAHKAWQAKKHEYACLLADMQTDERIASLTRDVCPDKDTNGNKLTTLHPIC